MRRPVQVLVYPVRRIGTAWEYLLLRRISSRGGFWQGVTGGVHEGEDLAEAARRELKEETGLVPSALEKIDFSYSFTVDDEWRHLYAPDVKEITEYVFIAYVEADKPTLDQREHDEWRWCRFEEALKLLRWMGNREALKRCDRLLRVRGALDAT